MTLEELWKENIGYYEELINVHKWDQQPMLDLINELEKEGLCKIFYPSNSHESLVLSMFDNFSDRSKNPRVLITYKSINKSFTIAYRNKYDDIIDDNDINLKILKLRFNNIREWLILPNRIK